jgi:hypothetical protein
MGKNDKKNEAKNYSVFCPILASTVYIYIVDAKILQKKRSKKL